MVHTAAVNEANYQGHLPDCARLLPKGNEPAWVRVTAAWLFADIKGFTQLSEAEGARGAAGAEHLSQLVNQTFGPLVDRIYLGGGDVVAFAGDALIACFEDEDQENAVRRAARCATEVVKLFSRGNQRLEWKIGIGVGQSEIGRLGGLNGRFHLAVRGRGIQACCEAQCVAGAREVVVHPIAATHLKEHRGVRLFDGAVRISSVLGEVMIPPSVPGLPVKRAYLSSALLQHKSSEWVAEFRPITVVFARLTEQATSRSGLQEAVVAAQELLAELDGSLEKVSVDEKGTVLMCVFGLLHQTHPDDPQRGLSFAWRLREVLGLDGVGIATGRTFCGVVGSRRRREYTMMGDIVNVAARLCARADGVLCDDNTARLAGARFRSEVTPLELKGRSRPVRVHAVLGWNHTFERFSSRRMLVGRAGECEWLGALLKRASEGQAVEVVVVGEAGYGKSHIGTWLIEEGRKAGFRVYNPTGISLENGVPYHGWRVPFQRLFGQDPDEIRARIDELLEPEERRLAPLAEVVLPLELTHNEATEQLRGAARGDHIISLLTKLLERLAAPRPTLVVVEDTHWLDESSRAVVTRLVSEIPSLLVVWLTRPVNLKWAEGKERRLLSPLSPEACDEWLRREHPSLSDESRHEMIKQSAGNPLFLADLCLAVAQNVAHKVPQSLVQSVVARLDRLPIEIQTTAKVASLVGGAFSLEIIDRAHPQSPGPSEIHAHLLELTGSGFLEMQGQSWIIRHDLVGDAIRQLVFPSQKAHVHRLVATFLASNEGLRSAAVIAYHYEQAQDVSMACKWYRVAGDRAMRSGSYVEASGSYRVLLSFEEDEGAQLALAEAALGLGELETARGSLIGLLSKIDRVPRSGVYGTLRLVISASVQFWRRWRGYTPTGEDRRLSAKAWQMLSETAYLQDDLPMFLQGALRGLELVEGRGGREEALAWAMCTGVINLLGQQQWTDYYADRAVQCAKPLEHLSSGRTHHILGFSLLSAGRLKASRKHLREGVKAWTRLSARREQGESLTGLCLTALFTGRPKRALRHAMAITHLGDVTKNPTHQVWGLNLSAYAALQQLDIAAATEFLNKADQIPFSQTEVNHHGAFAALHLMVGDLPEAQDRVNRALALWTGNGVRVSALLGLRATTEVSWALFSAERVPMSNVQLARKALKNYASRFRVGRPSLCWIDGQLGYRGSWQRGIDYASQMGLVVDEMRLLRSLTASEPNNLVALERLKVLSA